MSATRWGCHGSVVGRPTSSWLNDITVGRRRGCPTVVLQEVVYFHATYAWQHVGRLARS